MSRLGKKPIAVPKGVEIALKDGVIHVKGPKGSAQQSCSKDIALSFDGEKHEITLKAEGAERQTLANHGLYRALINNMITGVSKGFEKSLQLEGVGYRVSMAKNRLTFLLGFSHPVEYLLPPAVKGTLDGTTKLKLESHDKQLVGQVASEIRALRPPEPYKGKGIRYGDEVVRRKVGKAMVK